MLLLVNPLCILYYSCVIYHYSNNSFTSLENMLALHFKAWETTEIALLMGVINSYMYESWIYTLVVTSFFPVWVMLWTLVWVNPPDVKSQKLNNVQEGEDKQERTITQEVEAENKAS